MMKLRKTRPVDAALGKDGISMAHVYELGDERGTLAEWAEALGVSECGLRERIYRNLPPEQVFTTERTAGKHQKHAKHWTERGRTMLRKDWAAYFGVHPSTITYRIQRTGSVFPQKKARA